REWTALLLSARPDRDLFDTVAVEVAQPRDGTSIVLPLALAGPRAQQSAALRRVGVDRAHRAFSLAAQTGVAHGNVTNSVVVEVGYARDRGAEVLVVLAGVLGHMEGTDSLSSFPGME